MSSPEYPDQPEDRLEFEAPTYTRLGRHVLDGVVVTTLLMGDEIMTFEIPQQIHDQCAAIADPKAREEREDLERLFELE